MKKILNKYATEHYHTTAYVDSANIPNATAQK